eukprot:8262426-Pyramimonas_sp.AAC.1
MSRAIVWLRTEVARLCAAARPHTRHRSHRGTFLLHVKGNSVDVKGNSVDVKGNNVDVKGNSVDVKDNSCGL